MFKNYDSVERSFFQLKKFNLKVVVNFTNQKQDGQDKIKLDPIYKNEFNSAKYSNFPKLSNVKVKTGDYLVFAYDDWKANPAVHKSVYTSYSHLYDVKDFLTRILTEIRDNEAQIYNAQTGMVSDFGNSIQVDSAPFIGGSMMSAIPTSISDGVNVTNMVAIFFDDQNAYELFTFANIQALLDVIEGINLAELTGQLIMTAQLDSLQRALLNGNGGEFKSNSNNEELGSRDPRLFNNRNTQQNSPIQRRGNTGRPTANTRQVSNNRVVPQQPVQNEPQVQQQPIQNEPQVQQPVNNEQKPGGKRLSMSNIQKQAKTVDISDLNSVEEIDV